MRTTVRNPNREGDVRAMLKVAGIDSYLVTIYAGDRDFVHPEWAAPAQFNHMIIAIRVPPDVTGAAVLNDASLGTYSESPRARHRAPRGLEHSLDCRDDLGSPVSPGYRDDGHSVATFSGKEEIHDRLPHGARPSRQGREMHDQGRARIHLTPGGRESVGSLRRDAPIRRASIARRAC